MKWIVPLLLASSACAAPPGGAGAPAPAAAPEDVLYAQNLLANPGFEKGGFEKDRTKGWGISLENGMEAKIESAAPNKPVQPFEGRKALRIFVKDAAKYSTRDLLGDWETFSKGANGGKGPPKAELVQFVRVKPGSRYALRFRWRASGLYNAAAPGPERGLVNVTVRCEWNDANLRYMQGQSMSLPNEAAALPADSDEWATWAFPNYAPDAKLPYAKGKNIPFSAPGGAVYARIRIRFTCQRPKAKPEIWLDQFEFVEIPPGVDPAQVVQPNAAAPKTDAPAKPAAAQPAKPAAPGAQPAKPEAPAKKAAAPGAAPATEAKEGGVLKFRDLAGVEFHPHLALAGWKGSAKREKPDPGAPAGSFSYLAGDVRVRALAAFETAADGSLRASWRFTPEAEADLAMLGVVLHLPAEGFKGGSVRFDGTAVDLPEEPRENPRYYSGDASAVSVRGPDGHELFSFGFDAPARLALQDNRFWKGSVYELRILPPNPSPYPAGVEIPFTLSLRGAAKP
jgi:hypothetical protein